MKERIESNRRMMRRIQLRITPRIVNEQFREALDRYNKAILGQNDHNDPTNDHIELTQGKFDEAIRRLKHEKAD